MLRQHKEVKPVWKEDTSGASLLSSTVYISMMMVCGIQCVVVCVQLLEACVSNCGKDFQLELTKPAFQSDARAILTGVSTGVTSLVRQ